MLKKLKSTLIMTGECVRMSLNNIMGNKVRSFLTILGIMIGVTAVIALITTVNGVTSSISDSFFSMGAGTVTVSISGTDLKTGMTAEDLQVISDLEEVKGVIPSVSLSARVSRGGQYESKISVSGKNGYYFLSNPDYVKRGRALNRIDDDNMTFTCLINQDMIDTFFYGVDPVDEMLYINGIPFSVVGIFDSESTNNVTAILAGQPDILIPYTTALKMNNDNSASMFTVELADGVTSETASDVLSETLDPMFDFEEDTYTVTTMEAIENTMETMMGMMTTLLAGIASIALVVGGVGIMNMMLTTVTERTAEIGLKKALGARQWQIQVQFLIESFLLSILGGITGILFGLLLSLILCNVTGTTFKLSVDAILLGFGFSAAIGIVFGWAPARKASKLNPIDALRSM